MTGRANYVRFGKAVGIDLLADPEQARDPDIGILMAAKYFARRMMRFALADDIGGATRALNGGQLGLAERAAALGRAKFILRNRPSVSPTPASQPAPKQAPAPPPPAPAPSPAPPPAAKGFWARLFGR
jgi:hypothetical protein